MKHLVITIGCEYGAKGNAIGKKIAQDLGIKFYDRDLVDEIIKEVGIPTDIMDRVEEGGTIAGKGAQGDVRGSFSKYADLTDRAIHVQKQIIRKLAQSEIFDRSPNTLSRKLFFSKNIGELSSATFIFSRIIAEESPAI